MTDNNTHAILFELQKNLTDLSSAKEQMEEFRSSSKSVVQGIGNVQEKFVKHLTDLETDYKQRVTQLEESLTSFLASNKEENKNTIQKVASVSEKEISKGVEQFGNVASKVETSNDEKILAITKLLQHYKSVVEASSSLIDTLNAIDFPSKLDALSTKTQLIIESITNAKQALELKSNEAQTSIIDKVATMKEQIIQNAESKFQSLSGQVKEHIKQINTRQDTQDKEIKLLKVIAITATVISFVGAIVSIIIMQSR